MAALILVGGLGVLAFAWWWLRRGRKEAEV
jgi:hypothetical protein